MNKLYFGIIALSLITLLGIGMASAFGFGFGKAEFGNISDEEKSAFLEKRESIINAVESNDYIAWKSLVESEITQERFDQIVSHHKEMFEFKELKQELREARQSGDSLRVSEIESKINELGFEKGNGEGGNGFLAKGKRSNSGQGCHMMN